MTTRSNAARIAALVDGRMIVLLDIQAVPEDVDPGATKG